MWYIQVEWTSEIITQFKANYIGEVPMAKILAIETIDESLKDIMDNSNSWEGR